MNTLNKERRNTNIASLGNDGEYLRIRFSKNFSVQTWGHPSTYFYLGLLDSENSRNFANNLIQKIKQDVQNNSFDSTLQNYEEMVARHKSFIFPKIEYSNPLAKLVGMVFKDKSLSAIYEKYIAYKKLFIAETTYINRYQRDYRNVINHCPQDLSQPEEIVVYLANNHSPHRAKSILNLIGDMIEWAQRKRDLSYNTLNPYKEYAAKLRTPKSSRKPKAIQKLEDEGLIDLSKVKDKAFNEDEARAIVEAIESWMGRTGYDKAPWDLVVKFLFWTGCRQAECAGLQWKNISTDCSRIRFCLNLDEHTRILKGLKTVGKGADERFFYCGEKLQQLLLEMRPKEPFNQTSFVFHSRKGEPILMAKFREVWREVLADLIKQGKVRNYLTAYSTRHTFINLLIDQGVSFHQIADLVGNSAMTIESHYRSKLREPATPIEI